MKVCKVSSLPLKEVIESLANCFNVDVNESCEEYFLNIPDAYGKGQIRGINFDNGLGIIIYQCEFFDDVRIDFTVDDIHPIKYIYSLGGPISHRFDNEDIIHTIPQFKCAIVASKSNNGHILSFEKNVPIEVVSLEIDRRKFLSKVTCEINDAISELKNLYEDINAEKTFYHEGYYGIEFKTLLASISKYEDQKLVRKFYLQKIGLEIFVNQLLQFSDDQLKDSDRSILRANELNRVENITEYIIKNLNKDLSVLKLSRLTGLNPNKLQTAFKYLFNNTVNEYITNTRMSIALELLKKDDLAISEVVLRIGFKSDSYFSKLFREKYKITPSAYKNRTY